jgi:hypothetical protein
MSKPEDDLPEMEELTFLQEKAHELHEMYMELNGAGFTNGESLYILGIAVSGGMLSPIMYDEGEEDLPNQRPFDTLEEEIQNDDPDFE